MVEAKENKRANAMKKVKALAPLLSYLKVYWLNSRKMDYEH